jgi:lambda family phage tail tape measure protein
MTQTSRLVLEIDSRNAEQKAESVRSKLLGLNAAGQRSGPVFTAAGTALSRMGNSAQDAARKADSADKKFRSLAGSTDGLKRMIGPIVSVATAVAALNKAISVQRQFDVLNAGLVTATGSAEGAAEAFTALQKFAQATPYDLDQAVKGFTQLVNLGLTPSEKALISYGNTASALGKDLNQMIEAVADAATGEFERLKEFGVKAKQSGDTVSLTFQGVTKTIGNNAAEIESYLIALGDNQFAGAMQKRMETLDGAIANLGDTWESTFRLVNQAGLGELMQSTVRTANDALTELNDQLASGQLESSLSAISGKFDGFGRDFLGTIDAIQAAWIEATSADTRGGIAFAGQETVSFLIDAFRNLPENVRAFIQIMTVEVLAGFDQASAYAVAFKDGIKAVFSDDTFAGVGERLEQSLSAISENREQGISSILEERDRALQSFSDQMVAAKSLRSEFDKNAASQAANTADRLAQYKVLGDGSKQLSGVTKKAQAETQKAFDTASESYRRQIALFNTSTDKQKDASEASKLAFEIESGRLKGLTALQKSYLESKAKELDALNKIKDANEEQAKFSAFLISQQSQTQSQKNGFDLDLAGFGSGDVARERLRADLELRQQYEEDLKDLAAQRTSGDLTADQFLKQSEVLREQLSIRLQNQQQYYRDVDRLQSDWTVGASAALNTYAEQASNVAAQSRELFTNAFSNMEDAVVNFVKTGKLSFKDFADGVIEDLIRIQVRQAAAGFLGSAFGFLSGGSSALGQGTMTGFSQTISQSGFSGGGYTGDGGKFEPKGVVHGGEFVVRKEVVSQPGAREFLERMNRKSNGYADGGYVSPTAAVATSNATTTRTASAGSGMPSVQNIYQISGGADDRTVQQIKAATQQATTDAIKYVAKDFASNGPLRQSLAKR